MWRSMGPALRTMLLMTVITGIAYPLLMTGVCETLFPRRANGSLATAANGRTVVGSTLIAQNFTAARYFHPRPSAAGKGYDATQSGGSNYAATNQALIDRVRTAAAQFARDNPDFHGPLPADLLTTSGSGLDPDISPASARAQAARVAAARGLDPSRVRALIDAYTTPPQLGFLGEPRVNVLELNLALDRKFGVALARR